MSELSVSSGVPTIARPLVDRATFLDPFELENMRYRWRQPSPHSRQQELSIYWADRIRGPWRPHALNPVKLDARSSRPAGALFRRDGKWIRPAASSGSMVNASAA